MKVLKFEGFTLDDFLERHCANSKVLSKFKWNF